MFGYLECRCVDISYFEYSDLDVDFSFLQRPKLYSTEESTVISFILK